MTTIPMALRAAFIVALCAAVACSKERPASDIRADDGSAPPRVRERGELIYPDVFPPALGQIVVHVTVGTTGGVIDAEVIETMFDDVTNIDAFTEAALRAANGTSFYPSLAAGGYPQRSEAKLTFRFKRTGSDEVDPHDVSGFELADGQDVDVPPKLLHAGMARRPLDIWQQSGHVEIELLIDEFGRVYGTKLMSSTLRGETAAVMHRRVREAALRHEFEPAMKNGVPVPCRMRNRVRFEPVTDVHGK